MTGGRAVQYFAALRMLMHIRGGAELNEGLAYDGIPYVQGGYLVPITFSLSFFCPSLSLSFFHITSHHILSSRPLPCSDSDSDSDSHSHLSALLLYPPSRFRDLWC